MILVVDVVWDERCGFCARCVAWVRRRDRHTRFRWISNREMDAERFGVDLRERARRSVLVVMTDGAVLERGRAVLKILELLASNRGRGLAARGWRILARPPWVWLADAAYRAAARNRRLLGRIFGMPPGYGCAP